MSQFKVGDAVRVKAGISSKTHIDVSPGFVHQMDELRGKKLSVTSTISCDRVYADQWGWLPEWLEPWNDAEEWDGENWVQKKTADRWFRVKDSGKVYKAKAVTHSGNCCLDLEGVARFFSKHEVEEVCKYIAKTPAEKWAEGCMKPFTVWSDSIKAYIHQHAPIVDGDTVTIKYTVLSSKPLPKQYTFSEAYEMMMQGKWMRQVGCPYFKAMRVNKNCDVDYIKHDNSAGFYRADQTAFTTIQLGSLWEEA